ncbi:MAG TPA: DUF192 domain-containing protein [Solirubrobacteraceae bacterium]|nr:DUF192 domain-containing protein [Solirubrobacteraceae bacterium]
MPTDRFDGLPRRSLPGGIVLIEARTHRSRRRGLARLDALEPGHALHIPQTPSVHTFGMRFALDLIWLDGRGGIVRVDHGVGPRRIRLCLRARSVVETAAGEGGAVAQALGGASPEGGR